MHKRERHRVLLELIANERISGQSMLAYRLGEAGFLVTQASVSRDLDELGVAKVNGAYSLPQQVVEPANGLGAISFDTAGEYLIIGRCSSGLASAITVRIDAADLKGIVGTIAGDDTIFIAVKNAGEQAVVLAALEIKFADKGVGR